MLHRGKKVSKDIDSAWGKDSATVCNQSKVVSIGQLFKFYFILLCEGNHNGD
jgi:hypothetical protein